MERLSREYLELKHAEMQKQSISDERLIVELLGEISHLEIAYNTLRIEIKKMKVN